MEKAFSTSHPKTDTDGHELREYGEVASSSEIMMHAVYSLQRHISTYVEMGSVLYSKTISMHQKFHC